MKEFKSVVECPVCHTIVSQEPSDKSEHKYDLCDTCADKTETRRPIRRTKRNEFTI